MRKERWPVIIFCRISSLGETFDLFSLGGEPREKRKYFSGQGNPEPLFLVPSAVCDFGITSPRGYGRDGLLYSSAAVSAAKFLTEVRGLPLSELEIECMGQPLRILREGGRCGVVIKRFTLLSSCIDVARSAEIKTSLLRSPLGKIKVFETSAIGFCDGVLSELSLSRNGEEIIGAAAFERRNGEFFAASRFCRSQGGAEAFITAVAIASYLCSLGLYVRVSLTVSGMTFDVTPFEYGFFVTDRHISPLTLYAPDIDIE